MNLKKSFIRVLSNSGNAMTTSLLVTGASAAISTFLFAQSLSIEQAAKIPRIKSAMNQVEISLRGLMLQPSTFSCTQVGATETATCTINLAGLSFLERELPGSDAGSRCKIAITDVGIGTVGNSTVNGAPLIATLKYSCASDSAESKISAQKISIDIPSEATTVSSSTFTCADIDIDKPVLVGFNSSSGAGTGGIKCAPLKGMTCPANKFVSAIDQRTMQVTCSPITSSAVAAADTEMLGGLTWKGDSFTSKFIARKSPSTYPALGPVSVMTSSTNTSLLAKPSTVAVGGACVCDAPLCWDGSCPLPPTNSCPTPPGSPAPTVTASPSSSPSASPSPSVTASPTASPSASVTASVTPSPTPTVTSSPSPSPVASTDKCLNWAGDQKTCPDWADCKNPSNCTCPGGGDGPDGCQPRGCSVYFNWRIGSGPTCNQDQPLFFVNHMEAWTITDTQGSIQGVAYGVCYDGNANSVGHSTGAYKEQWCAECGPGGSYVDECPWCGGRKVCKCDFGGTPPNNCKPTADSCIVGTTSVPGGTTLVVSANSNIGSPAVGGTIYHVLTDKRCSYNASTDKYTGSGEETACTNGNLANTSMSWKCNSSGKSPTDWSYK